MMSVVSLLNVNVKNNPAQFGAPYEFEITFECLEPLQKGRSLLRDLEIIHLIVYFRFRVEVDLCWFCDLVSCHVV